MVFSAKGAGYWQWQWQWNRPTCVHCNWKRTNQKKTMHIQTLFGTQYSQSPAFMPMKKLHKNETKKKSKEKRNNSIETKFVYDQPISVWLKPYIHCSIGNHFYLFIYFLDIFFILHACFGCRCCFEWFHSKHKRKSDRYQGKKKQKNETKIRNCADCSRAHSISQTKHINTIYNNNNIYK